MCEPTCWIYDLYLWIYLAVILKTLSCYYLCTAILFRYLVINDANKLEQIWLLMTPKNWCRKYIQKVNMLQREKMQKKNVQHYSYIRLRRKCKKMVRKHATLQPLQIYEGQMCLFMWHLTLLAPQVVSFWEWKMKWVSNKKRKRFKYCQGRNGSVFGYRIVWIFSMIFPAQDCVTCDLSKKKWLSHSLPWFTVGRCARK